MKKELDLDISKLMELRSMDNEFNRNQTLSDRKQKLEQILSTYNFDNFNNKTIQ